MRFIARWEKRIGWLFVIGGALSLIWTIPAHDPTLLSIGGIVFGIALIIASRMMEIDLRRIDKDVSKNDEHTVNP